MRKITISVSIDIENLEYCKRNDVNISKWVNSKMNDEFLDYDKKIELYKKEAEEMTKKAEALQKEKLEKDNELKEKLAKLSKEQKAELEESKEILKRTGMVYFDGRYNRYINLFGAITKEEFLKLVNS